MKPGGWLELSDFEMEHFSDDDTLHLAPSLGEWFRLLIEASAKFNRPMKVAADHRRNMIQAGFTDVKEKIYKVGRFLFLSLSLSLSCRFATLLVNRMLT